MSVCLAFNGQLSEYHRSAHGGAGIPNNKGVHASGVIRQNSLTMPPTMLPTLFYKTAEFNGEKSGDKDAFKGNKFKSE